MAGNHASITAEPLPFTVDKAAAEPEESCIKATE